MEILLTITSCVRCRRRLCTPTAPRAPATKGTCIWDACLPVWKWMLRWIHLSGSSSGDRKTCTLCPRGFYNPDTATVSGRHAQPINPLFDAWPWCHCLCSLLLVLCIFTYRHILIRIIRHAGAKLGEGLQRVRTGHVHTNSRSRTLYPKGIRHLGLFLLWLS